jgi:hypothetical protein
MLNQLGWCTAPNIKITLSDVIETQLQSLTPSRFKTGGMSDQTKHVLPTVVLKSRNLNRINRSGDGFRIHLSTGRVQGERTEAKLTPPIPETVGG